MDFEQYFLAADSSSSSSNVVVCLSVCRVRSACYYLISIHHYLKDVSGDEIYARPHLSVEHPGPGGGQAAAVEAHYRGGVRGVRALAVLFLNKLSKTK